MNKNLKNIETILTALIVTVVIISGSSISVTINKITELKNIEFDVKDEEQIIN